MQPVFPQVPCLPETLFAIARHLGRPMIVSRHHVLPVGGGRRFQVWEFRPLSGPDRPKVIAVDLRGPRIRAWRPLDQGFEAAVECYRGRIDAHRGVGRYPDGPDAAA